MQVISEHKILSLIIFLLFFCISTVLSNVLWIRYNGENVPAPYIPREVKTVGSGDEINYVIYGDSTSIAQGAEYNDGYVVGSAEFLGKKYRVTYQNFGVSGARTSDVLRKQLPESKGFIPDIALIAVGSNDVTHLTHLDSISKDTKKIIDVLRERNPDVKIVLTGSASMGDVARFPYPTKWLARVRTNQINAVYERVATEKNVTFAYIARETGPLFAKNQDTFFAADNFHPNAAGYAVWTPAISQALDTALSD